MNFPTDGTDDMTEKIKRLSKDHHRSSEAIRRLEGEISRLEKAYEAGDDDFSRLSEINELRDIISQAKARERELGEQLARLSAADAAGKEAEPGGGLGQGPGHDPRTAGAAGDPRPGAGPAFWRTVALFLLSLLTKGGSSSHAAAFMNPVAFVKGKTEEVKRKAILLVVFERVKGGFFTGFIVALTMVIIVQLESRTVHPDVLYAVPGVLLVLYILSLFMQGHIFKGGTKHH